MQSIRNAEASNGAVWSYTYDYAEARMTRFVTILPSGHGKLRGPKLGGVAFYDYTQRKVSF
jgi:hypothetical protein